MNPRPIARRATRLLVALAFLAAGLVPAAGAQAAAGGPSVTMAVALHLGAVLKGGDGADHLRIRLEAARVKLDKRLPLNIVLVIDRSGSMSGPKIRNVREAAKFVVDALQDGDILSVVSFDNGAEVLQPAAAIESLDRARVKTAIDRLTDRGGTDMVSGLRTGLAEARKSAGTERVNRIVLLSDGIPDTQSGLAELAASGLDAGIFLTTMGVGRDYNEDLMSRLADAGSGNYYFIEKAESVAGIFEQELKDLMAVVAREGVVTIETASGVTIEEVYGYESSPRRAGGVTIPVGDLFSGRSADILVRVKAPVDATGTDRPIAKVRFAYHDAVANQAASAEFPVALTVTEDASVVEKQTNAEVGAKVVRVSAADAKKKAMALYEEGRRDEAKKVLRSAATRARDAGAAGAAAAPAATKEAEELEALTDDLDAAPASGAAAKSLRKQVKKDARDATR